MEFLQDWDTARFSRGLHLCTHYLICALFIGTDVPAIYTSSVTPQRNFPYVRCVISMLSVCWGGGGVDSQVLCKAVLSHTCSVYIGCYMWTMSRHCAEADKGPSQTVKEFKWSSPIGSPAEAQCLEWEEREKENKLKFCHAVLHSILLWKTWLVFCPKVLVHTLLFLCIMAKLLFPFPTILSRHKNKGSMM